MRVAKMAGRQRILLGIAGLTLAAIAWEGAARIANSPLFPPFTSVLRATVYLFVTEEILPHVLPSLQRLAAGTALAASVAVPLGVLMSECKWISDLVSPLVDVFRSVAGLAIFPLIILVLGIGDSSKIFLVFWAVWPAILLNTIHGLSRIDTEIRAAAQIDGASRTQTLRYISLPLARASIVAGLRIGLGFGWIGLTAGEMIAGSSGLGYFILFQSQVFRFERLYAGVLILAALAVGTHVALTACENALKRRPVR